MDYFSAFMNRYRTLSRHKAAFVVDALVVGGSVGRGSAKADSDLDMFLLIEQRDLANFLSVGMYRFAELGGDVSLFRGPVFVDGFGYSFTALYDLSFICQFNVNTRQMLKPNPMWNPDSVILFDKSGYYSSLLHQEPVSVDSRILFQQTFTFFWLRAITAATYVKRGNLWATVSLLHDLRAQMMILYRLMKQLPPPGANYRFPAKRWEDQTSKEDTCFLESSLCRYDAGSVRSALLFCSNWFLQASSEYIVREGIEFGREIGVATHIYTTMADRAVDGT
jgi:hypothetical protein